MMSVQPTELDRHVRAEKKVVCRELPIFGNRFFASCSEICKSLAGRLRRTYAIQSQSCQTAKRKHHQSLASHHVGSSDNKKIETFRHMRKINTPAFPEWLLSSVSTDVCQRMASSAAELLCLEELQPFSSLRFASRHHTNVHLSLSLDVSLSKHTRR